MRRTATADGGDGGDARPARPRRPTAARRSTRAGRERRSQHGVGDPAQHVAAARGARCRRRRAPATATENHSGCCADPRPSTPKPRRMVPCRTVGVTGPGTGVLQGWQRAGAADGRWLQPLTRPDTRESVRRRPGGPGRLAAGAAGAGWGDDRSHPGTLAERRAGRAGRRPGCTPAPTPRRSARAGPPATSPRHLVLREGNPDAAGPVRRAEAARAARPAARHRRAAAALRRPGRAVPRPARRPARWRCPALDVAGQHRRALRAPRGRPPRRSRAGRRASCRPQDEKALWGADPVHGPAGASCAARSASCSWCRTARARRCTAADAAVVLTGKASELVLYVTGRQEHADVEVAGPDDAVAAFRAWLDADARSRRRPTLGSADGVARRRAARP